jgi:hypothetical protein
VNLSVTTGRSALSRAASYTDAMSEQDALEEEEEDAAPQRASIIIVSDFV